MDYKAGMTIISNGMFIYFDRLPDRKIEFVTTKAAAYNVEKLYQA
jgi:hypothetical protein